MYPAEPRNSKYNLINRHQHFLELKDLLVLMEGLRQIYADTQHEMALALIQRLQYHIDEGESFEDMCRAYEINEIIMHPGRYPSAVVMWVMSYREKELAYEEGA